jgi:hypothetical protein
MDAVNHALRASVAYLHHLRIGNGFANSVVSPVLLVRFFPGRVNVFPPIITLFSCVSLWVVKYNFGVVEDAISVKQTMI